MGQMKKDKRKISGKIYHIVGRATPVKKKSAQSEAKRLRKKGFKTRVIKAKKGYRVFSRYV